MTSTKSFSTKNAGVLVVAVFSIAISIGLSQVSTAMALDDILNCKEIANGSNDLSTKNTKSCDEKVDKVSKNSGLKSESDDSASSNDDEDVDKSSGVKSSSNDDEDVDKSSGVKSSSNDDEDADKSSGVKSEANSVLTAGPAVASPDDHIIKPINLNKGTESDEPLKTNADKNKESIESSPKQIFQDKLDLSHQFDRNTNTGVSELYESFDLPYTAIYKNQ